MGIVTKQNSSSGPEPRQSLRPRAMPRGRQRNSEVAHVAPEAAAAGSLAPAGKGAKGKGSRLGFAVSEFVVYPAHGVGEIVAIEAETIAGFALELFVIWFAKIKLTAKVPVPKALDLGLRKLAEAEVAAEALTTLSGQARISRKRWVLRAKDYQDKIHSGDLIASAEVLRDLFRRDGAPEAPQSERELYEAARGRVAGEIAFVRNLTETETLKEIEARLKTGRRRRSGKTPVSTAAAAERYEAEEIG